MKLRQLARLSIILPHVMGHHVAHHSFMLASALFEKPEIPRAAKPDFSAVDRVESDDVIADRNLFGGEQKHEWLSLVCTPIVALNQRSFNHLPSAGTLFLGLRRSAMPPGITLSTYLLNH